MARLIAGCSDNRMQERVTACGLLRRETFFVCFVLLTCVSHCPGSLEHIIPQKWQKIVWGTGVVVFKELSLFGMTVRRRSISLSSSFLRILFATFAVSSAPAFSPAPEARGASATDRFWSFCVASGSAAPEGPPSAMSSTILILSATHGGRRRAGARAPATFHGLHNDRRPKLAHAA